MATFDLTKRIHYWFNEISKIPHGSKNEKALSDMIVSFAKEHHLSCKQDEYWNVIIEKEASEGCEDAKAMILQAHIDMVNEKTMDSAHNFETDPLQLYEEDGWLKAKDTTLGADDGKGVAYMLAILEDDSLVHPYLQCFFTVQEEIGLVGAKKLHKEDIKADRFISLDGGGETMTCTASAAACRQMAILDYKRETNMDEGFTLIVRNLLGGHSAGAIAKERGNAILFACRILYEADFNGADIHIDTFEGGSKNNAIPSYAKVTFTASSPEKFKASSEKTVTALYDEFKVSEPNMKFELLETPLDSRLSKEDTDALLTFLMIAPNGFMRKSQEIEGLTALSSNIGVIHTLDDSITIDILTRADRDSALFHAVDKIGLTCKALHFRHQLGEIDPAWFYTPDSAMREIFSDVLERRGKTMSAMAVHGGLECGVFKGLNPNLDIITFGAISTGEHSVEEQLDLESYERSYEILCEILEESTKR